MKNNFYKVFSILLCIATLFMGVGYASINSVSLNISGEIIAQAQNGIFITAVNYNAELSNNVLVTDSKINSSYQTNLDSSIVLTNNVDSQITYNITIYNSNDLAYVFDGVEHTIGENTYSNENITYKLTDLVEGDVVNSNDDITFSITFYFKDASNISNIKLDSILNFKFSIASYVVDTFDYTGNYETFMVPHTGTYKIELWGASGGINEFVNEESIGKGAYTAGIINLNQNSLLYVYVGGRQTTQIFEFAFNGGSPAEAPGGGATDIRLVGGEWNNFNSLKSRIMVAGGGGGGVIKKWNTSIYTYEGENGDAGGLVGYDAHFKITNITNDSQEFDYGFSGYGASQTSGGMHGASNDKFYELTTAAIGGFGIGGYDEDLNESGRNRSSSGGSGYYGGGHGVHPGNAWTGGGGGSSFISGHNGCDAILESSTNDNIIHTGQSIHYSGYQFTNTVMIDGRGYNWTTEKKELIGIPTYDGIGSMIGNDGTGYARITFVSEN